MRNLLLFIALLSCGTGARATDYTSLVFRLADGTETRVSLSCLEITFAGGNLVAKAGGESRELPLATLRAMYFSTDGTTGVRSSSTAAGATVTSAGGRLMVTGRPGATVRVYNAAGVPADAFGLPASGTATTAGELPRGVYTVIVDGEATKTLVR